MSDPVTNVEIEDVLSSIRRLVSDGDKARTRDPAPSSADRDPEATNVSSSDDKDAVAAATSKPDKLVLTPALMVVDAAVEEDPADVEQDGWFEPETQDGDHETAGGDADARPPLSDVEEQAEIFEEPLQLSDMIVEAAVEVGQHNEEIFGVQDSGPDRSQLVATIAELEAAIGEGPEEFELDGSEEANQTISWPGTSSQPNADFEDDETVEGSAVVEPEVEIQGTRPTEDQGISEPFETTDSKDEDFDDFEDDDLDGLLDAGGVAIDEEALRELVASVVREELSGPMGERITRNVRKLVRREIYRILSSHEFD